MDFLVALWNLLPSQCLLAVAGLCGIWVLGFLILGVITGGHSLSNVDSCEGCLIFPFVIGLLLVVLAVIAWNALQPFLPH